MLELEVFTLYREDDRSNVSIKQKGDKFLVYVSRAGKHCHVNELIKKKEVKQKIIDFIINGYNIKTNLLFPNLYNDLMKLDLDEHEEKKDCSFDIHF